MKFIMLKNVKMPTTVDILTFISLIKTTSEEARKVLLFPHFCYEQLIFHAQLSWAWRAFIVPDPVFHYFLFTTPTWKSKVSSQLNTSTNLPSWFPRAFTDSVLPVPAGPVKKITNQITKKYYKLNWGFSCVIKKKHYHYKCLNEMVLLSNQNICCNLWIRKYYG